MRIAALLLLFLGSTACSPVEVRSTPLSEPGLVDAIHTLVHLDETHDFRVVDEQGQAAVRAVKAAIHEGGSELKAAAISALKSPDESLRMRAQLALQALGVDDDELQQLAASPDAALRLWAMLATDDFPLAAPPYDGSSEASATATQEFLAQHSNRLRNLFSVDEAALAERSDEAREFYRTHTVPNLKRPHEHVEANARRVDVTGDQASDWVCTGTFQGGYRDTAFLLVVDGQTTEVLIESKFDDAVSAPRCIDVSGDGRPEILISTYRGNPLNHFVHAFEVGREAPIVFADRFVKVIRDPVDGAVWIIETGPFNAFGGTATMLCSACGATHQATRLGPGLSTVSKLTLLTDHTDWW